LADLVAHTIRADVVLLNDSARALMVLCLLQSLFRFRLVSVDLVLRQQAGLVGTAKQLVKRWLFSRVDRFLLYHKDIEGYRRFYGIGPDRAVYVPFKVNGWEQRSAWPLESSPGGYVLCAGRTLRDIRTFVEAMRIAGCPGIILQQRADIVVQHGTSPIIEELPSNLQLIIDEESTPQSFARYIAGARVVVIPRYRGDIAATGISTYLLAMALGRCVIISDGPGAGDLLRDEAVIVPPGDADQLASAIGRYWRDDEVRTLVAWRGRRYAYGLQGEERLVRDIVREIAAVALPQRRAPGAPNGCLSKFRKRSIPRSRVPR
jgi:glycosyltransferase involved in cell wall biosynthesis